MKALLVAISALASVIGAGAPALAADALRDQVRAYTAAHQKPILEEFVALLALPNVATSIPDIETNASHLRVELDKRGFTTRSLYAGPETPPAVYGELQSPGAKRTVVFYAHYDGQPAAQPEWRSDPFKPVVRDGARVDGPEIDWRAALRLEPEWRVFARSASDDKAPIQAMLSALDALEAAGRKPTVNIKVFYEGEEEQGSPNLSRILQAHKSLLTGDLFVLSDGPRHPSGRMQVFFGARGVTGLELTVYGPLRPLHSGHYGNWAPNPAVSLVRLLSGLRDDEGRILIPGFYDDVRPLTSAEQAALAALPDVETQLRRQLALGRTEGGERVANAIARPALNLRGVRMGDVGDKAANAISTEARASIDFRLVHDQTPQRVRERVEAFLRSQGWFVTADEPDAAVRAAHARVVRAEWSLDYPAYRADMEAAPAKAVVASIARSTGSEVLRLPMLGGSVPMDTFARELGMPIVGVPLANADNNQHAANENLRLQNLWDGIEIYAGLLTDLQW